MSAGISDQNTSQIYMRLGHTFIKGQYFFSQSRNVNASVTLTSNVEIIASILSVLIEEHAEGHQVVFGDCCVVGRTVFIGCG